MRFLFFVATNKKVWLVLACVVLFGVLLVLPNGNIYAQCTVDGNPGQVGDGGNNNVVCNAPTVGDVEGENIAAGVGGNDNITIGATGSTTGNVEGEEITGNGIGGNDTIVNDGLVVGAIDGEEITGDGTGGNDSIVNNGTANFTIEGDDIDGNGNGGDDTIVNNGTAATIAGEELAQNLGAVGNGGNDSIVNNGLVTTGIGGDAIVNSGNGGNDTIVNNGTVNVGISGELILGPGNGGDDSLVNNGLVNGILQGDVLGLGAGGNDTITNNGTVNGNLLGAGGDDIVNIQFGSTVTGLIRGGEADETVGDTITFTQVSAAVQAAIIAGCPTPDAGCILNVNGVIYDVAQFENIAFLLEVIVEQLNGGGGGDGEVTVTTQETCVGAVKVFRLPNGDLEVYSGFDLLVPNGFLVARIPLIEQVSGAVFSNLDAPIQGWTATLEMRDSHQHIVVRDGLDNIVNDQCMW